MVKNAGGNKSKKQARKTVGGGPSITQNVRYVKEEGEMYAVITKIYGGKTCQVMCDDGVSRRCTIRRKFMMSRRGENALAVGSWIMAGLYDWEKRTDGSQTCDILEVYSTGEREKLKQTVNTKILKHIMVVNNALDDNKNGSEFVFSDTLADIANNDDEDEESDQEEEVKLAPIIPLKELLSVKTAKKENDTKDQLDWVHISLDDI
jgi:hypothetical protein